MAIQRYPSTRDAKAARRTLATSLTTDAIVVSLLAMAGIALLGFYQAHPADLAAGQDRPRPQATKLFPKFIMTQMPAGLAGLVLAAILSAAMSSLSVRDQLDLCRAGAGFSGMAGMSPGGRRLGGPDEAALLGCRRRSGPPEPPSARPSPET